MALTTVTYTGDGTNRFWSIPFPFVRASDIKVSDADGDPITTFTVASGAVEFDEGTAPNGSFTIYRETEVDTPVIRFADNADLSGTSLNQAADQVRYRIQELENLLSGPLAGATGEIPTPVVAQSFLVSQSDGAGGYDWAALTKSATLAVLGVSEFDPGSPGGGFKVLTAQNDDINWLTESEMRDELSLNLLATHPDPTTSNLTVMSYYDSGSDSFKWTSRQPSAARSALGLGTASVQNVGTAVGNVVQIQASQQLPAINGDNLKVGGVALSALALGAQFETARYPTSGGFSGTINANVTIGFTPSVVVATLRNQEDNESLVTTVLIPGQTHILDTGEGSVQITCSGTTVNLSGNTGSGYNKTVNIFAAAWS